ncbi:MAG: hypothetical protein KKE39_06360 [Bacteroidetes bacterium]|nr:hypothetical protein [Bacteroidota bacterium]MBU1372267.1 hypothetical protein [Bacteroidota bacterium]MBU1486030.1 hypothetical protein [Bacteroidota bacterium]MBU1759806.1 hypothetical protein [Bacteroidota bacterium]MBU2268451.1 hypothetical protein [Bacteroidota bacterium]
MKNTASKISHVLSNAFDLELFMVLNRDLKIQKAKMKQKFIQISTSNFDMELLEIIKRDAAYLKAQLNNSVVNLAQAS